MAKVEITFKDYMEKSVDWNKEDNLKKFLEKYATELGDDFISSFYDESGYDEMDILPWIEDLEIDTHSDDPKIKTLLNLISKIVGENQLGFGLGYEGFSDKFYEDFFNAVGYISIDFQATVIGYGDEYTNCSIELTAKGWKVARTELYAWDEEDETYYSQERIESED